MSSEYNESRRNFLRSAARGLLLAAAAGGVFGLVAKRGESCTSNGICRGCGQLSGCGLPQALSLKAAMKRGADGR